MTSSVFDRHVHRDNLISLKTDLDRPANRWMDTRSAVHTGLGCRVHADQMIPLADGIALAADSYTPKVTGQYPAVVVVAAIRGWEGSGSGTSSTASTPAGVAQAEQADAELACPRSLGHSTSRAARSA